LLCIDCTGHGVPGAFVTMIVKSIEREIVSKILKHPEFDISPATIMAYFNKTMKILLHQETKESVSNAGFDGGIIYYNRRDQILKFSGAETSLFYIDENREYHTIKGSRYSVGYKKCDIDYEYKETTISVQEGMKFYCTTDGYIDQNGGEKGFPFGKKRFGNIIKENHEKSMKDLHSILMSELVEYQNVNPHDNNRNDDITVVTFEIGEQAKYTYSQSNTILTYSGVITQNFIETSMENLEARITNMNTMAIISTITIEVAQNIMHYSKNDIEGNQDIDPTGYIEVTKDESNTYRIISKNIISKDDKERLLPALQEIENLDKVGIKKRYKELRRSGKNAHNRGAGLGMYEIAKIATSMSYKFESINANKCYFTLVSTVAEKGTRSEV